MKQEDFPDLPGGVKLTTKKAGKTSVFVTLKTLSGQAIRSEAELTISSAKESGTALSQWLRLERFAAQA